MADAAGRPEYTDTVIGLTLSGEHPLLQAISHSELDYQIRTRYWLMLNTRGWSGCSRYLSL